MGFGSGPSSPEARWKWVLCVAGGIWAQAWRQVLAATFLLSVAYFFVAQDDGAPWPDDPPDLSLKTLDDDSGPPIPPTAVRAAQQADDEVAVQLESVNEAMGPLEVLDAYFHDKEALKKGTAPEGFEQPPFGYYKENGVKSPLTAIASPSPAEDPAPAAE